MKYIRRRHTLSTFSVTIIPHFIIIKSSDIIYTHIYWIYTKLCNVKHQSQFRGIWTVLHPLYSSLPVWRTMQKHTHFICVYVDASEIPWTSFTLSWHWLWEMHNTEIYSEIANVISINTEIHDITLIYMYIYWR